jgi:hypothetical protein
MLNVLFPSSLIVMGIRLSACLEASVMIKFCRIRQAKLGCRKAKIVITQACVASKARQVNE